MPETTQKKVERWHKTTVDTTATNTNHAGVQHMARTAQNVAEQINTSKYTEGRANSC